MNRPARLLFPFMFLLAACAQVVDISGGERDVHPPELIAAEPAPLSTFFTGERILLMFNERIQLDRVRERLLVSPPLSMAPQVRLASARSVQIDLGGPLRPNTTYSFSIGEAIKDLTEGNFASGLVYVVSTGAYLDSLQIAGRVVNAFTGLPEKDVLVLAHDVADTGTVRTARPAFATRTGANGSFILDHLRSATYQLYALRDQNGNYRYDLPNEEIAFLDGPATPLPATDSLRLHDLRLFKGSGALQQIRDVRVTEHGALRLTFDRPAQTVMIADVARSGGALDWVTQWVPGMDTVLLWPTDTTTIGMGRYQIATEDGILDTVAYRRLQKMPFNHVLKAAIDEEGTHPAIVIHSTRPRASVDTTLFELVKDSVTVPLRSSIDAADPFRFKMYAPIAPGDRSTLRILPKAVIDIYGGWNDTLRIPLGRAAEGSQGTLRVTMMMDSTHSGPFILQLLDTQGKVIRESGSTDPTAEVTWDRLAPGKAFLRVIEDRNNNGRWDTGDLSSARQPEMVWNHPESLNIRAAWDLRIEWRIEVD